MHRMYLDRIECMKHLICRAKEGTAISAYYGYLKGVNNELALKHVPEVPPRNDTLAGPYGRRGDQVRRGRVLEHTAAADLAHVALGQRSKSRQHWTIRLPLA